jgi:hypothetical protein
MDRSVLLSLGEIVDRRRLNYVRVVRGFGGFGDRVGFGKEIKIVTGVMESLLCSGSDTE